MEHLGLVFGVRRRQLSVDGGREAAVVLVVVGQLQVQQAGAGGQVDVLHVIHLGATHRAQLEGQRARVSVGGAGKTRTTRAAADRGSVYIPGLGETRRLYFSTVVEFKYGQNQNKTRTHDWTVCFDLDPPTLGSWAGWVNMLSAPIPSHTFVLLSL